MTDVLGVSQLRAAAIGAALCLVPGNVALACSCYFESAAEHVKSAQMVFSGVVRSVKPDRTSGSKANGIPIFEATFAVKHVWKGKRTKQVRVMFLRAGAAVCGIDFEVGSQSIIFANLTETGLATDFCTLRRYYTRKSEYDGLLPGHQSSTD